ncbi:MAG: 3-carboxymuconate cyclase, partial [Microbacterium sp.]
MRFFAGGYSPDMDGHADGIGVLHAGEPDSALAGVALSRHPDAVATGGSPSWLAWHPTLDVLYAALEGGGTVRAFRRTGPESFAPLGDPAPVGDLPCHVAVEPGGRWLIVTCWGDGRVVRVALDPDGAPRRGVAGEGLSDSRASGADPDADIVEAGLRALLAHLPAAGENTDADAERAGLVMSLSPTASPVPDATQASRAHQACFLPGGGVATTDMGRDVVRFWRATGDGLSEIDRVALPPGTGPRHAVWHPSGHLYVITELSLELFVLAPPVGGADAGRRGWRLVGGSTLSPAVLPGDKAAEVALSREAEFVYA